MFSPFLNRQKCFYDYPILQFWHFTEKYVRKLMISLKILILQHLFHCLFEQERFDVSIIYKIENHSDGWRFNAFLFIVCEKRIDCKIKNNLSFHFVLIGYHLQFDRNFQNAYYKWFIVVRKVFWKLKKKGLILILYVLINY